MSFWRPGPVGNPDLGRDARSFDCGFHGGADYSGVDDGTPAGQDTFILFLSSDRIPESNPDHISRVDVLIPESSLGLY